MVSVSIDDIAKELAGLGIPVEKRHINMSAGSLGYVGEYTVELRLDAQNVIELPVAVVSLTTE